VLGMRSGLSLAIFYSTGGAMVEFREVGASAVVVLSVKGGFCSCSRKFRGRGGAAAREGR
jgi:hypothetical protein